MNQKIVIEFNYRKCFRCNSVTEKLDKQTCKCGRYMYQMGGCYMPKTVKRR